VTGDVKAQNSSVRFEVVNAEENKLKTKIIGYEYLPSSVRRLVRRRMSKVDDSLVVMTKDGQKVRIKPVVLTRGKVTHAVEFKIRASVKKEVIDIVNNTPYDELFTSVLKNKLQNEIKNKFSILYPIRAVVIRVLKEEKHHAAKLSEQPKKISLAKRAPTKEKKEKKAAQKDDTEDKFIEEKEAAEVTEKKKVKKAAKE